ncbi:MAG TPA: hypothetical protein VGB08_09770 [Allosphingosinicella sp.]
MTESSLTTFTAAVGAAWGPISTGLVATCRERLEELIRADPSEEWLAALLAERPASRELYRDAASGFMLLAHNENEGLYRPPHDHGRAWVVYGVQSGALEIRTYGKVAGPGGEPRLVLRDTTLLEAGEARAYLPGDIHDTRCLTACALLFRFTERDLRHEDQVEHKLTRFIERDGHWTVPRP